MMHPDFLQWHEICQVAALEWFAANITGKLIPLSEQFYVDCMEDDYGNDINGCKGGIVTNG